MKIKTDKLNSFFRDTFKTFANDYLSPDEDIEWLGNWSGSFNLSDFHFPFGFIAISTKNVWLIYFDTDNKFFGNVPKYRSCLYYSEPIPGRGQSSYGIIAPLTFNLTEYENKSVYIKNSNLRLLIGVQKNNYELTKMYGPLDKNETCRIVSKIIMKFLPNETINICLYDPDDGHEVYKILQKYISENTHVTSSGSSIIDQLIKLDDLYKQKIINDEEFEKAKKRIIEGEA